MHRSARKSVRLLPAAVLALLLTGCTVEFTGWVTPADEPTATTSATATAAAAAPATTATDPTAAYPEWVAAGWTPAPLVPVTDDTSKTGAMMFGPVVALPSTDTASEGTLLPVVKYRSLAAPASVTTWFGVHRMPAGQQSDARVAATATAELKNARLVSVQDVTVAGHAGVDVRLEMAAEDGRPAVNLLRIMEVPGYLVVTESLGYSTDDRVIQQVQAVIADTLQFP
jgi:hypothetical protein